MPKSRYHACLCAASLCLLLPAPPAMAQVLDISADGHTERLCPLSEPAQAQKPSDSRLPARYAATLQHAARRYHISTDLLDAVARAESGYDAGAISPKGAIGIMQLMPATARALNVDPYDPAQNINGGAAYLRYLLDSFDGRIDLALAAYNAGQGAITRYGTVPPFAETRAYLARNFADLAHKSDRTAEGSAAIATTCR